MTVTIILSWAGQDAATVRAATSIKDDLVGPASLPSIVSLSTRVAILNGGLTKFSIQYRQLLFCKDLR